jgi:hypothetical protein
MKSVRIFCLAMLAPLALLSFPGTTATNLPATNLLASGAYSEAFKQCLRDAMKGVTSDRAAEEAVRACREQSPGGQAGETDLPADALAKVIVHAGFGWGIFSGSLYNGNSDYALTQVTVVLTPMKKSNAAEPPAEGREYDIALAVQPLAKAALSMPIPSDNTLEYSWKIARARGFKTR